MKSRINRNGKFDTAINWIAIVLVFLLIFCVISYIGLSFEKDKEGRKKYPGIEISNLATPEFLTSATMVTFSTISLMVYRHYSRNTSQKNKKTKKISLAIAISNLVFLCFAIFRIAIDSLVSVVPTIDIFKLGSVIILFYNTLFSIAHFHLLKTK